jgi:hypothetical protein
MAPIVLLFIPSVFKRIEWLRPSKQGRVLALGRRIFMTRKVGLVAIAILALVGCSKEKGAQSPSPDIAARVSPNEEANFEDFEALVLNPAEGCKGEINRTYAGASFNDYECKITCQLPSKLSSLKRVQLKLNDLRIKAEAIAYSRQQATRRNLARAAKYCVQQPDGEVNSRIYTLETALEKLNESKEALKSICSIENSQATCPQATSWADLSTNTPIFQAYLRAADEAKNALEGNSEIEVFNTRLAIQRSSTGLLQNILKIASDVNGVLATKCGSPYMVSTDIGDLQNSSELGNSGQIVENNVKSLAKILESEDGQKLVCSRLNPISLTFSGTRTKYAYPSLGERYSYGENALTIVSSQTESTMRALLEELPTGEQLIKARAVLKSNSVTCTASTATLKVCAEGLLRFKEAHEKIEAEHGYFYKKVRLVSGGNTCESYSDATFNVTSTVEEFLAAMKACKN